MEGLVTGEEARRLLVSSEHGEIATLSVDGDLDLSGLQADAPPCDDLRGSGSLHLRASTVRRLPRVLVVQGNLDVSSSSEEISCSRKRPHSNASRPTSSYSARSTLLVREAAVADPGVRSGRAHSPAGQCAPSRLWPGAWRPKPGDPRPEGRSRVRIWWLLRPPIMAHPRSLSRNAFALLARRRPSPFFHDRRLARGGSSNPRLAWLAEWEEDAALGVPEELAAVAVDQLGLGEQALEARG